MSDICRLRQSAHGDADLAVFQAASESIDKLLQAQGIDVEEPVCEFDVMRKVTSLPSTSTATAG